MATYDKEKDLLVSLQGMTKSELKTIALKDNRSVNNFINVAIKKYSEEINRRN